MAALVAAAALLIVPASANACRNTNKGPAQISPAQARTAILCLINKKRARAGHKRLRRDARLEAAASAHSQAMAYQDFFSHISPDGSSPLIRILNSGYTSGSGGWGIAENLAWGSGPGASPRTEVRTWMGSAAHREPMLGKRYRHIGIGIAIGSPAGYDSSDSVIYTIDFGYR